MPKPAHVRCIDHVNMRAKNLSESIAFYHDIFGFEVKEDHSDEGEEPWVIIGQ